MRASALSDECNALHEVFRGQLKRFSGGQQDCVRRRAVKSLEMNPNCKVSQGLHISSPHESKLQVSCPCYPQAIADKAVNDVFVKCYNDELPFSADKKRAVFNQK